MELLDLPPEVFQNIVDEFVRDAGVREAWNCRSVCRTFSNEIYQSIFSRQHMDVFATWDNRVFVQWNVDRVAYFLFVRTKVLLGAREQLPKAINAMSDFLVQQTGTKSASGRDDYTMALCRSVASRFQYRVIPYLLPSDTYGSDSVSWLEEKLNPDSGEKIAAAAAIRDSDLFSNLLSQCTDGTALKSELFETPIILVASGGYSDIAGKILQYIQQAPKDVRSRIPRSQYAMERGINTTMKRKDHAAMKSLLDIYTSLHYFPSKDDYSRWLRRAAEMGDVQLVNVLLDMKVRRNLVLGTDSLVQLCKLGDVSIITALVDRSLFPVDKSFALGHGTRRACALLVALSARKVEVLSVLLDAGADVDGPKDGKRAVYPPLHQAIRNRDNAAVKLLLDRGARFYLQDEGPCEDTLKLALRYAGNDICELLRQAKINREGRSIPAYI